MVPGDALLLTAAVLSATLAWMQRRTPRWLIRLVPFFAYPVVFLGAGEVAGSLVDAYMVGVVHVRPGEAMYLDELAYPLRDALIGMGEGCALVVLGFFLRDYSRRLRRGAAGLNG